MNVYSGLYVEAEAHGSSCEVTGQVVLMCLKSGHRITAEPVKFNLRCSTILKLAQKAALPLKEHTE